MKKFGLAEILYPMTVNEFLKSYWPKKFLVVHKTKTKLESLLSHPFLENVETLLANRTTSITASLPDFNDEYSSLTLNPEDALKAYRNGMSLTITNMQAQMPELNDWLWRIRGDLGLPVGSKIEFLNGAGRSISYASPDGRGTSTHYDCNANFVIQIKGSKRWRLASNTSIENPVVRYTTRTPIPNELAKQCHGPLPSKMPKNHNEVVLKPGSVLFVPRGMWHETLAEGESLSLNFTFTQPTWADVFSASLRSKLHQNPKWRGLADNLGSIEPKRKNVAIKRYSKLLDEVIDDLKPLNAETYLPTGMRYVRTTGLKFKIKKNSARIFRGEKILFDLEVNPGIKKFLSWVLLGSGAFSLDEARKLKHMKSDIMTVNLLEELEKAGALTRS